MNKGFTLIELLAVLIILAVISLITVPIITNIEKKSKNNMWKISAENYVKAVDTNLDLANGTYYVLPNGNLCDEVLVDGACSGTETTINVKGKYPNNGLLIITNELIEYYNLKFADNVYVSIDNLDVKITKEKIIQPVPNLCTAQDGVDLNDLQYGDKFSCTLGGMSYTFYMLEDGDKTTLTDGIGGQAKQNQVSLIMDRNIGNAVAWISNEEFAKKNPIRSEELKHDGDICEFKDICAENTYGPITANQHLASQTSKWQVIVSLPSYNQIKVANNDSTSNLPAWLCGNLTIYDDNNQELENLYKGLYGYWTASPRKNLSRASVVYYNGSLSYGTVVAKDGVGVRPVITISKSSLN